MKVPEPVDETFADAYLAEVLGSLQQVHQDNFDFMRFPKNASASRRLRAKCFQLVTQLGWFAERRWGGGPTPPEVSHDVLSVISDERFNRIYRLWSDEPSRQLMVKLLAFRLLGHRRVKLPTNTPAYWSAVKQCQTKLRRASATRRIPGPAECLDYFEVPVHERHIKLHCHPVNVLNTFLLEQYCYSSGNTKITAASADVVLDAGGGVGDTALYFASRVGKEGRVHCFECSTENLQVLHENLALNDPLSSNIHVVDRALHQRSGEQLSFSPEGLGSRVEEQGSQRVMTQSIDDFVEAEGLERLDFIKMDIEGAEPQALKGAEKTLRRFRPRLAIAVYHRPQDLLDIPEYVNALGLEYQLHLGHFSIHSEETVLFARPHAH